jgi:hypothetical protein
MQEFCELFVARMKNLISNDTNKHFYNFEGRTALPYELNWVSLGENLYEKDIQYWDVTSILMVLMKELSSDIYVASRYSQERVLMIYAIAEMLVHPPNANAVIESNRFVEQFQYAVHRYELKEFGFFNLLKSAFIYKNHFFFTVTDADTTTWNCKYSHVGWYLKRPEIQFGAVPRIPMGPSYKTQAEEVALSGSSHYTDEIHDQFTLLNEFLQSCLPKLMAPILAIIVGFCWAIGILPHQMDWYKT